MTTLYNIQDTFHGVNSFGTSFCDDTYSATLAANTDTAIAVPLTLSLGMAPATTSHNTYIAVFHYAPNAAVYVANNTAAAAPVGGAFALTSSVLNPTAKKVKAGDTLHFLCVAGCVVIVEFFATQEN